jgi:hypothetical protein
VLDAMRSPTAFGRRADGECAAGMEENDDDEEEEEEEDAGRASEAAEAMDLVAPHLRFGALPSYHHRCHLRWLEVDEDAD